MGASRSLVRLAAGCDGYIAKPIDTRKLPGIVATFLRADPAIPAA